MVGMLYLPIRPARWEESGTWGVWVYARSESEKAGEVKYMRTGKAEWARGTKEKFGEKQLSRIPRHLIEFIV